MHIINHINTDINTGINIAINKAVSVAPKSNIRMKNFGTILKFLILNILFFNFIQMQGGGI